MIWVLLPSKQCLRIIQNLILGRFQRVQPHLSSQIHHKMGMEIFISSRPERHETGHLFRAHGQIPWSMPSKGALERLSKIFGTETSYSVPFVGRTFPAALVSQQEIRRILCLQFFSGSSGIEDARVDRDPRTDAG